MHPEENIKVKALKEFDSIHKGHIFKDQEVDFPESIANKLSGIGFVELISESADKKETKPEPAADKKETKPEPTAAKKTK